MDDDKVVVAAMLLTRYAEWLLDDLGVDLAAQYGVPVEQQKEWLDARATAWIELRPWLADPLLAPAL